MATSTRVLYEALSIALGAALLCIGVAKMTSEWDPHFVLNEWQYYCVAAAEVLVGLVFTFVRAWRRAAAFATAVASLVAIVYSMTAAPHASCGCLGRGLSIDNREREMLAAMIGASAVTITWLGVIIKAKEGAKRTGVARDMGVVNEC